MMLENIKISTKMNLSYAVIIMFIVCVGFYGSLSLHSVEININIIGADLISKIKQVNSIINNVRVVSNEFVNIIMDHDQKTKKNELQSIAVYRQKEDELFKILIKKVSDEKGVALVKAASELRNIYVQVSNKFIGFVTGGQIQDASQLMFGELRQAQSAYLQSLDDLVMVMEERSLTASVHAEKQASAAEIYILILLGGFLIVSVLVSLFTIRSITGSVDKDLALGCSHGMNDFKQAQYQSEG
jgi:methyl-accepting chemotaxis protein